MRWMDRKIARLEAENKRLRAALAVFADENSWRWDHEHWERVDDPVGLARTALSGEGGDDGSR